MSQPASSIRSESLTADTGAESRQLSTGPHQSTTHNALDVQLFRPKGHANFVDRFFDVFQEEALTDRDYVPRLVLNELVTQKTVNQELARIKYLPTHLRHHLSWKLRPLTVQPSEQGTNDGDAKRTVGKNFQKVFAILVWIRCPARIWAFVRENVHDGELPLCLKRTQTAKGIVDSLRRNIDSDTDLICLRAGHGVREFVKHQWNVLAPSFDQRQMIPIARLGFLPLLTEDNKVQHRGFGELYKITVHEGHHLFARNECHNDVIAVKKVHPQHRSSLVRDYNILCRLRKMEHAYDHLVTLLTTYEQDEHFYLFLPWPESNLYDYWREKTPAALPETSAGSSWIQEQCCGLVGALSTIHHYFPASKTSVFPDEYSLQSWIVRDAEREKTLNDNSRDSLPTLIEQHVRHGDIKPENIIFYPKQNGPGVLRLANFGISHSRNTPPTSTYGKDDALTSEIYSSPGIISSDNMLFSHSDVWALGCVFLEFLCWFAGGSDLVKKFEEERAAGYGRTTFSYPNYNERGKITGVEMKEPVQQMITKLEEATEIKTDPGMKMLISTIQQEMLVISKDCKSSSGRRNIYRRLRFARKPSA